MVIKKSLPICSLEVDSKNGNIWLNASTCLLRISGLKFKTKLEKFSSIDIVDNEAHMIKEISQNEKDEALNSFLISITQLMYSKQIHDKPITRQKQIYRKMISNIKKIIEEEQ